MPTLNAARNAALSQATRNRLVALDCALTILAEACQYFSDTGAWDHYGATSSAFGFLQGQRLNLKRGALIREQPTGYTVYRDPGGALCSYRGDYYLGGAGEQNRGDADFFCSRKEADAAIAEARRQIAPPGGNHAGYNWGVIEFPRNAPA